MATEKFESSPLTPPQAHWVELLSSFEEGHGKPANMDLLMDSMTMYASVLQSSENEWEGARESSVQGFDLKDQNKARRRLNALRAVYQDSPTIWDNFCAAEDRFKTTQMSILMRHPQ